MLFTRVIPTLLLNTQGLVKGVQFKDHRYVGDVMNTLKIFNTKEVDEIILLDIGATAQSRSIDPTLIEKISNECLMPFAVGGGICTFEQAKTLLAAGAEKVVLCTSAVETPELIAKIATAFGNQAVVVCIDVKITEQGYQVRTHCGSRSTSLTPLQMAQRAQQLGAGEILLNSIDRDGTGQGYDLALLKSVSDTLDVPVIALGGAGSLQHFSEALTIGGATAVAAGSHFVFVGRKRAVLINYPSRQELDNLTPCRT